METTSDGVIRVVICSSTLVRDRFRFGQSECAVELPQIRFFEMPLRRPQTILSLVMTNDMAENELTLPDESDRNV
jgi:hypothetical protein